MDQSPRRAGIAPEIGVLALVAAASLPLARLFHPASPGETPFGQVQILTVVVAVGVAWGLRRLRVPVLLSAVLSGVAFLWFGSLLFHAGDAFGPFPTPASIDALFDDISRGIGAVSEDAAPVAPTARFLAVTAMAIWATAWLADDAAVRLRHPLLAIALTVPMFAMPGTLLRPRSAWVHGALFAAAALIVLFQDERSRLARWAGAAMHGWRPGLAARIGAVAIVIGAVTAPLVPGYGQPPGANFRGGGGRLTVNPLVSIRPSLDRFPTVDLFQVRSPAPAYWRLTSLDRFDGRSWSPTPEQASLAIGRGLRRVSPAPVSSRVVQRVRITNLAGPWIPAAYEPVSLSGITGVRAEPVSRTLVASDRFPAGQQYTVVSEIPAPTADDLRGDVVIDEARLERYLALPEGTASALLPIARAITLGATTPFDQAVAIQDHLRTFTYDEKIALRHGFSDIVKFLTEVKAGYCEQFAATMAVLARVLGIPARVAIGFGTGDQVDAGLYNVTSRQAHAWPEIFFPNHGWMAFEPTPRSDGFDPPNYTRRGADLPTDVPDALPSPGPATPSPEAPADGGEETDPEAGTTVAPTGDRAPVLPVGLIALVLALVLALPVAAAVRRVIRRRRAHDARDAVAVRYLEFLEWCRAAAVGRVPAETPREHARRLAARDGVEGAPVLELAWVATTAVYGDVPPETGGIGTRVKDARRAVARSVPTSRRLIPHLGWGWWLPEDGRRKRRR